MRARLLGPILCVLACSRDVDATDDGTTSSGGLTVASTWGPDTTSSDEGETTASTGVASTDGSGTGGDAESTGDVPGDGPLMLYVASGSNLYHFEVDLADGTPMPVAVLPVGQQLGPMTRRDARIYVGDLGANAVQQLSLATDGSVSPMDPASIDMQPVYLAFATGGRHLLVADYGSDRIASFADSASGLDAGPATQLTVGQHPHAIVPSPDGAFVFVPHLGSGEIRQYRYDDRSGALTPNLPAQVQEPTGDPRHLVFDASATHAYVSNEIDDSVTTWDYDAAAGRLSNPRTVSTLPGGMSDDGNTVAELRLTPDGRFLYASNRGHDSLAIFAVDDGELTPKGHADTAPTPRAFTIEPGGRFIYVGGLADGSLVTHVIADDGSLTRGAELDVWPEPMWIEAVVL